MKRLLIDVAVTALICLFVAAPTVFMFIAWPYTGAFALISLIAYLAIWEWLRDFIGLPLPGEDTAE